MAKTLSKRELERREELKLSRRRKSVLIVMSEVALCLILAITCYGMSVLNSYAYEELNPSIYKETPPMEAEKERQTVVPQTSVVEHTNASGEVIATETVEVPQEIRSGSGYRNILVLGTDARSQYSFDDSNGINTDVMIIVSINNETGDIKMVSILRDTIMKMEEGTGALAYDKANAQFSISGISDTVSMINRNLGLDIDEYVIVNWYDVAMAVNQLGGIELTIPNEKILTYFNNYLDFTNQATGLWAPELHAPGTYVMTGTQVVAFCRIR